MFCGVYVVYLERSIMEFLFIIVLLIAVFRSVIVSFVSKSCLTLIIVEKLCRQLGIYFLVDSLVAIITIKGNHKQESKERFRDVLARDFRTCTIEVRTFTLNQFLIQEIVSTFQISFPPLLQHKNQLKHLLKITKSEKYLLRYIMYI